MKLNDDILIIQLPMSFGGTTSQLNLSVIVDPVEGVTLVDTGLPGQEKLIEEALAGAGIGRKDLKRIVLTHQDMDHVGSLEALRLESGAKTLASAVETPYIQGDKPGYKIPSPERLAQMPEFKAVIDAHKFSPIDQTLENGERLDIAGGVRIVATPGHTPGHISLYHERTKTLIAGDALVSNAGILHGPSPQNTPDMETANASVKALAELDVATIVCYHGGLVTDDANGQLRRIAGEARSE